MITITDYLNGKKLEEQSSEIIANCNTLIPKVNELLEAFGESRSITSGLRTKEDHIRIYNNINNKRKAQGLPEISIPWGSAHLIGAAVDLEDNNGKLDEWCMNNEPLMEQLGLWFELNTPGWCHAQCRPAKHRFFKP